MQHLNVYQLAKRLGVASKTIARWHDAGLIPKRVKVGGRVFWLQTDIEEWERNGCPPRTEKEAQNANEHAHA